jgi:excisionase family DNA binding protein
VRMSAKGTTVPVRTAAKQLGVTAARVYQMIEEGKLIAQKVDKTVLVFESSIDWAIAMRTGGVKDAA